MRQLAVEGGKPLVRSPIRPLVSIGPEEVRAVHSFLENAAKGKVTLSGYLAGAERGGAAVQMLEHRWCQEFGVKHAIACNSGTSALMTAYWGAGVVEVAMPTMAMSAIAAVAEVIDIKIRLTDVNDQYLMVVPEQDLELGGIVTVNLFGQPMRVRKIAGGACWISDNAQGAWSTFDGKFAGSSGEDITCWSLNVHKPNNSGEGGICTTNNNELALRMRHFVNHGEVSSEDVGLNLRMPELTAVLALAQMPRARRIVERQREIAHLLGGKERRGCQSSWYCFPLLVQDREWTVKALIAEGVPVRAGYTLIHKLPVFADMANRFDLKNAEELEAHLVLIELCSIDPTDVQVEQMREAIYQIASMAHGSA